MIQNKLVIKIFRYVIYALITVAFILTPIMNVQANPSNLSSNKPFGVELIGLIAGFGTTFAALPDLFVMLKKRSRQGINPRMAAITGIFQWPSEVGLGIPQEMRERANVGESDHDLLQSREFADGSRIARDRRPAWTSCQDSDECTRVHFGPRIFNDAAGRGAAGRTAAATRPTPPRARRRRRSRGGSGADPRRCDRGCRRRQPWDRLPRRRSGRAAH